MAWLKRLLCRHEWELVGWAWMTSPFDLGRFFIEAEYRCAKCGRTKLVYPPKEAWPEYYDKRRDLL